MKYTAFITVLAVLLMNLIGTAHAMGVVHDGGAGVMHSYSDDHSGATDRDGDCGLGGHHHFSHWYGHSMQVAEVLPLADKQPVAASARYSSALFSPPARPPRA